MRRRQLLAGVSALAITAAAGPALAVILQPPREGRCVRAWRAWNYLDRMGFEDEEKERIIGMILEPTDNSVKHVDLVLSIRDNLTRLMSMADPVDHRLYLGQLWFIGERSAIEHLKTGSLQDLQTVAGRLDSVKFG